MCNALQNISLITLGTKKKIAGIAAALVTINVSEEDAQAALQDSLILSGILRAPFKGIE